MARVEIKKKDLLYPELSYDIIGCAFEVFNELGSGHSEKYYQNALSICFRQAPLNFEEQAYYPLKFKNEIVGKNFIDFVVDNKIVVEIKKDVRYSKSHIDQVLRYLKTSNLKLAILINFGKEGVTYKRIVNIDNS